MTNDPFKALAGSSNSQAVPNITPQAGDLVSPAPSDARPAMDKHKAHGVASGLWTYLDQSGAVLGHVARFNKPDGSKVIMPQTYWCDDRGAGWRWKVWPDKRPLYGLDRLAARPNAPVLIVEGEKTKDEAQALFPDLVAVCWQGGSNAVSKADWGPLQGRQCVLLPDADEAGLKAAKAVRSILVKQGVIFGHIIALPSGLPKGWDVADTFPDEFSIQDLRGIIDQALKPNSNDTTAYVNMMNDDWPDRFSMSPSGLWFQPRDTDAKPQFVSGPFEVLGEARDGDGLGWSVVIQFTDRDGIQKTAILPKSQLTTASTEIRRSLADQGFKLPRKSPQAADHLADCLLLIERPDRIKLSHATGWAGSSFVLPSEVISKDNAEKAMFTGESKALYFGKKGNLASWQERIAKPMMGNARGVFALSAALAGPLLKLLDLESGGFHFRGGSSCGKSTLAMVAGSIWGGGGPLGFAQSWRSTSNALESVAAGHSDTCLILDELAQVAPEDAGNAAYMLSNGQAKSRLKSDASLRSRAMWRTVFLSTGEISLSDHIKSSVRGGNVMAGQELRVIDLRADAGHGLGVWDNIQDFTTASAFSDALKGACKSHYGHAGSEFVKAVIDGGESFKERIKECLGLFVRIAIQDGDTGQIHRAAHRFALVAAAGEAAIYAGVLPWAKGEAMQAALTLFQSWAASFGRTALKEDTAIISRIIDVIQRDGSRFASTDFDEEDNSSSPRAGEARSLSILGYKTPYAVGGLFFITSSGWGEIFKGLDGTNAARVLRDTGYLDLSGVKDSRFQKKKKIKGLATWCYWVKFEILEHDFGA